jgi:HK97 family phage portal protein
VGILTRAFEKRSQLTNPEQWLLSALGYRPSLSGVNVSENRAANSSVVWRAVTLLGGTIGSLPLPVYVRKKPRGKERDSGHRLYYTLHDRPNPEITSFTWRTMGIAHQLIWGNWYNEIEFDRFGYPVNLWPISPWRVKPYRNKNRKLFYELKLPDGTTKNLPPAQVLHVKNLYVDGDEGMSCLRAGREAIGLGLAAEEFGARFFGEGANVGGVAEHPGKLGETAYKNLRDSLNEKYAGLGKSHRIMLLEEGMKYQRTGIPPNEAQFLETRKFQVAEIGRFFFITQLHKLGDLERATFSNIEEQGIDFVVDTIRPLLVNIEQEFNYKLFHDVRQEDSFTEFVIDGLLRGNSQARAEFYNKIFQIGGFSVNDILELENRNPIGPEGDERFVPMNMVPLKQALDEPDPPPALPDLDPDPEDNSRGTPETRSAATRFRIAQSYKRIFEDAGKRIVKREEADVMRKARELLGSRDKSSFLAWLEEFYKKHPDYVKRQMLPAVASLAEAIQAEVAGEIDIEAGMTPELEKFTQEYVDAFAARHVGSSRGQLVQVINAAHDAGEDELEALETRFSEWNERRPGKIASRETVQINGAVFRYVAAAAGMTKLIWRNTGSKTCPFCKQLDGKVVGIEMPFIPANDSVTADDGSGMKVYGPKMHPPIHDGCVCSIETSR